MIRAGIIGSTGYAGGELTRLLLQREDVEIVWYGSRSYIDKPYASGINWGVGWPILYHCS